MSKPQLTIVPPHEPPPGLVALLAQMLARQLKDQAMLQSRDKAA